MCERSGRGEEEDGEGSREKGKEGREEWTVVYFMLGSGTASFKMYYAIGTHTVCFCMIILSFFAFTQGMGNGVGREEMKKQKDAVNRACTSPCKIQNGKQ